LRAFVTGGAGFIGSALVDRLLADGHDVTAYDNFSTGQRPFLADAGRHPRFRLVDGDILDAPRLRAALAGHDIVLHLAANADVRFGLQDPRRDLEQNTVGTFNVLEAMRAAAVRRIAFASTGSVYGEPAVFPTPETCPFPAQTSLYGASKLAGEGLVAAYCSGFGFQGVVFRFVSVLGERYTHGHVFDLYKKLLADPRCVEVLGDGHQRKSYLHVRDCVDAVLVALGRAGDGFDVFNLGVDDSCTVDESLGWICDHLGLAPARRYTGGARGWVGDSPFILLDTAKIRRLGWAPSLGIRQSVIATVEYLHDNPWVLERP
jgi:UDP-glucose 4-epimerase